MKTLEWFLAVSCTMLRKQREFALLMQFIQGRFVRSRKIQAAKMEALSILWKKLAADLYQKNKRIKDKQTREMLVKVL